MKKAAKKPNPAKRRPSSASVRDAIVSAALRVFSQKGYAGARIHEIVQESGFSRPTVYEYFDGKEALFTSIVKDACRKLDFPDASDISINQSAPDVLRDVASRYRQVLLNSELMELYRLAISEVRRFPHLGRIFFEAGPLSTQKALASILTALNRRGEIEVDDPMVAAEHFENLIVGPARRRILLMDRSLSTKAIDQSIEAGLKAFMKAYVLGGTQSSKQPEEQARVERERHRGRRQAADT